MLDQQITFTNILTHLRQQGRPASTEAQWDLTILEIPS